MDLRNLIYISPFLLLFSFIEPNFEKRNDGLYVLTQVNGVQSNELLGDTMFLVFSINSKSFQSVLISKNLKYYASTRNGAELLCKDSIVSTRHWNGRGNYFDSKYLNKNIGEIILKLWNLDSVLVTHDEMNLTFSDNLKLRFTLSKIGHPENILGVSTKRRLKILDLIYSGAKL